MNALVEDFCRTVRRRSEENARAMMLLHSQGLYGVCMAVLRQEVDSLVRVIYLLRASAGQKQKLLQAAADGAMWKRETGKGRLTDREMVELATQLEGWTASVYKFGCAFIHLSRYHDYKERDPLSQLSDAERISILQHMRHYHGGPHTDHPSFGDLAQYFPQVFRKIRSNLESYLQSVEKLELDQE